MIIYNVYAFHAKTTLLAHFHQFTSEHQQGMVFGTSLLVDDRMLCYMLFIRRLSEMFILNIF